ncbi:MAG: alternative ribosome rescue aminoacyl-tRNA hydrolase ArfB [Thermoguttaceae bacterium]|jgi:ribosome-associated protein|nr:alternative ribosome rescue aminoacyl-tRNA hydrolase ArfB [Thermoguttaceae bacterium]
MLVVNAKLKIPLREFRFRFARSGGPGGQNVNKLNTKAELRWHVTTSSSLPEAVRQRLLAQQRRRVTSQGEMIVTSQRFRDAGRNVADCLEKLRAMIDAATVEPKSRRATKPTRASQRRRLQEKQRQSEKKQRRRQPPTE